MRSAEEKHTQEVLDLLTLLEPTKDEAPRPARQALAGIKQHIDQRPANQVLHRLWQLLNGPSRRLALATAFLLLFAVFFSFPTVRATASEFLGLFRVQKFAAISVSPEQIAILEGIAEEGLTPGEVEMIEVPGESRPVGSLSEASAITELEVRSPAKLGAAQEILVTDGSRGRLTIDLAGSRAILAAGGVAPTLLPDSLEGQQVLVTLYAGVEQRWADGTWLLQSVSPLVEYPDEMDPAILGQALLQILGLNEDEAMRLSLSIDWTSTLLLPVPQELASFSEVQVDGQSSLALSSLDGQRGVIMWQRDGVIYLLNGSGSTAELVSIANSMR